MRMGARVSMLLTLLALLVLLPVGCWPSPKDQRIGQLEAENAKLQGKVDQTEEAKRRAEEEKRRAEEEKQKWQMLTIVGVSIAVILLFVGAGLGSSARRRARGKDEQ